MINVPVPASGNRCYAVDAYRYGEAGSGVDGIGWGPITEHPDYSLNQYVYTEAEANQAAGGIMRQGELFAAFVVWIDCDQ